MSGEQLDAVNQFRLGPGVLRNYLVFFDQMNFGVEFFKGNGIAEIAVKPVRLFDQHDASVPRTF